MTNKLKSTDAYSANILQRKENNNNALYYLHRDYLGSILAITNNVGAIVEKRHFDAWGNVLLVRNGQNNNPGKLTFVERGYTGHEHLQEVGLINMNARLYDPKLHRFLAPDNFVQEPNNSQNYNRYGYALNNPLKYTDPSGEFLVGFISGLIKGIENGGYVWRTGIDTGVNEMKITWGLFKTDPNKTFAGQVWEVVSRFTWQSPQVLVGNIYSNVSNWGGQVDNVDYKYGATVISGNNWGSGGAVTLGNFIIGDHDLVADPNNSLFQHEYGHYLQSQAMGPAYLQIVGFPSLIDKGDHDFHPVEQDANRRAFKYFSKEVNGFYQTQDQYRENVRNGIRRGWDFWRNPLNVDGSNQRDQYVDYRNAEHMRLLSNLVVRSMWYDYLDTFIPAGINTSFYNNR